MSDNPTQLQIPEIPNEVQAAAFLVQNWFRSQGIKQWQYQGLCARDYALAIQRYVPHLHSIDPRTNGDARRAQMHNEAVKWLRTLVYS